MRRWQDADGFSIIEMIIAMFLLAVLALAVLPLLAGAAKTSTVNTSLVAATALANSKVAPIRDAFPNGSVTTKCTALTAQQQARQPSGNSDDLQYMVTVATCPSTFPSAVKVTVTVYKGTSTTALVTLPTKIYVAKAS